MQPWIKRLVWGIPLMLLGVALLGGLLMILWNWLIPTIFQGPQISFAESLGLLIMGRLLTGMGGQLSSCGMRNKKAWTTKWSALSPEEKQTLIEKYKHRCQSTDHRNNQDT